MSWLVVLQAQAEVKAIPTFRLEMHGEGQVYVALGQALQLVSELEGRCQDEVALLPAPDQGCRLGSDVARMVEEESARSLRRLQPA